MATTLFLDTEFNGFGGSLISLALFNPAGESFYEVVDDHIPGEMVDPWVLANVVPVLGNLPVWRREQFNKALRAYLSGCDLPIIVVADWPADFEHFFASLMIEGHWEVNWPIEARLLHSGSLTSAIPHNALEDAKALAAWFDAEGTAATRRALAR